MALTQGPPSPTPCEPVTEILHGVAVMDPVQRLVDVHVPVQPRLGAVDHRAANAAPAWDERDPTIFRGEIAFIRAQKSGGRTYDYLRIGNTTSGSKGTKYLGVKVRVTRFDSLASPELT